MGSARARRLSGWLYEGYRALVDARGFFGFATRQDDWQIILHDTVAYYDGHTLQTFIFDQPGKFVAPPRGKSGASVNKIITMDGSNGLTMSEVFDQRDQGLAVETDTLQQWHQFAQWYITQ